MPSAKKTNGWQHKKIGGKLLLQTFEGKSSLLTNESLYLFRGGIRSFISYIRKSRRQNFAFILPSENLLVKNEKLYWRYDLAVNEMKPDRHIKSILVLFCVRLRQFLPNLAKHKTVTIAIHVP